MQNLALAARKQFKDYDDSYFTYLTQLTTYIFPLSFLLMVLPRTQVQTAVLFRSPTWAQATYLHPAGVTIGIFLYIYLYCLFIFSVLFMARHTIGWVLRSSFRETCTWTA